MNQSSSINHELTKFNVLFPKIMRAVKYRFLFSDPKNPRPLLSIRTRRLLWAIYYKALIISVVVIFLASLFSAKDIAEVSNMVGVTLYVGLGCYSRAWAFARSPDLVKDTFFMNFAEFKCNHFAVTRARDLLNQSYKHVLKVHRFVCFTFRMNCVVWLVLPLAPQLYNVLNGAGYDSRKLPTVILVETGWGHGELRYLHEVFVAFSIVELLSTTTCLLYAVVYMVNTQYQILEESLHRLSETDGKKVPTLLKYFIQDQLKLRRISIKLCEFLSPVATVTVINVIFWTSMNLTLLTMQPSSNQTDKITGYIQAGISVFTSVSELTLYCFLSEKLCSANSSFSRAMYSAFGWKKIVRPHRSIVYLPMVICGREIRLVGSNLVILRLSLVVDVLKFTYSYCAVLAKSKP